jgi:hypothetical protein
MSRKSRGVSDVDVLVFAENVAKVSFAVTCCTSTSLNSFTLGDDSARVKLKQDGVAEEYGSRKMAFQHGTHGTSLRGGVGIL